MEKGKHLRFFRASNSQRRGRGVRICFTKLTGSPVCRTWTRSGIVTSCTCWTPLVTIASGLLKFSASTLNRSTGWSPDSQSNAVRAPQLSQIIHRVQEPRSLRSTTDRHRAVQTLRSNRCSQCDSRRQARLFADCLSSGFLQRVESTTPLASAWFNAAQPLTSGLAQKRNASSRVSPFLFSP